MYFADKTNYSYYLKTPIETVWNVGWLANGKEYPKGEVDSETLSKLASILVSAGNVDIHVNRMRSLDPCSLSGCEALVVKHEGNSVDLGGSEIWIPSVKKGEYFACPSLVYHYIEEHDYMPPVEFLEAIQNFDLETDYLGQDSYLAQVKGHF